MFQGLTLFDLRMPIPLDFLYDVSMSMTIITSSNFANWN